MPGGALAAVDDRPTTWPADPVQNVGEGAISISISRGHGGRALVVTSSLWDKDSAWWRWRQQQQKACSRLVDSTANANPKSSSPPAPMPMPRVPA